MSNDQSNNNFLYTCAIATLLVTLVSCTSLSNHPEKDVDALLKERGVNTNFERLSSNESSGTSSEDISTGISEEATHRSVNEHNKSITVSEAVTFALKNNQQLEAARADIGFAMADLYDAQRIRNPVLSMALLKPESTGSGDQLSIGLSTPISDIVTLRARKKIASTQYATATTEFAAEVFSLVAEVENAFHEYAAAKQILLISEHSLDTAQLSLALAKRFLDAGNLSPKELAIERSKAAKAELKTLRHQAEVARARHHLADLMGTMAIEGWETASGIQPPPKIQTSPRSLVEIGIASRLDLSASMLRAEYLAQQLKVTDWNRWLQDLEAGFEIERETDGERLKGPHLGLTIPIFDTGRGEQLRQAAELRHEVASIEALSLSIRNDIMLSHAKLKNLEQQIMLMKHQLIPAERDMTSTSQQEQNFMLIGVFELLETKQHEYETLIEYVDTLKSYWQTHAELSRQIGNQIPSDPAGQDNTIDIEPLLKPMRSLPADQKSDLGNHSHHQH